MMDEHKSSSASSISRISLSFVSLLYFAIIWYLYNKYKDRMEPVHILEINKLVDQVNTMVFLALLHLLGGKLGEESWLCKMINIFLFASIWSYYLGFLLTQVDRFLALYWNISYKERVTNNKALVLVTITKIISIILAMIAMLMDPDWFKCQCEKAYQSTIFKTTNAFYFSLPMTLGVISVIVVLLYSLHLILKIFIRSMSVKTRQHISHISHELVPVRQTL